MAQLNATTVDGNLTVSGNVTGDNINAVGILNQQPSAQAIYLTDSLTDISTSYNYFPAFGTSSSVRTDKTNKGNLTGICRQIDFGDRTAQWTNGVKIGKNVHMIYASAQVRFKNGDSTMRNVGVWLYRERNGSLTTIASGMDSMPGSTSAYATVNASGTCYVEEGDMIVAVGYKGTAAANVDVIGGPCTQLSVITV